MSAGLASVATPSTLRNHAPQNVTKVYEPSLVTAAFDLSKVAHKCTWSQVLCSYKTS